MAYQKPGRNGANNEIEASSPSASPRRRASHGLFFKVTVLTLTALISWILISVGVDDVWRARSDATADWLVAKALVDGRDPHANLYDLAAIYDVQYWDQSDAATRVDRHPRTPGALVLLAPIAMVQSEDALAIMLAGGLALAGLAFLILGKLSQSSFTVLFAGLVYVLVSGPARWSYLFGTQSPILFACIAISTVLLVKGDSPLAGLLLGIATTLKIFPIILLLALVLHRRYKAASLMLGTTAVLNGLPLLLPNVTVAASLATLTSSTEGWHDLVANISSRGVAARLFAPPSWILVSIQVGLIVTAFVAVVRWSKPLALDFAILMIFGILISPLAWPHYVLLAVGPVLLAACSLQRLAKYAIGMAALLTTPIGAISLYPLALTLAVGALMYRRASHREDHRSKAYT